jgi:hypothetical protein
MKEHFSLSPAVRKGIDCVTPVCITPFNPFVPEVVQGRNKMQPDYFKSHSGFLLLEYDIFSEKKGVKSEAPSILEP